MVEDDKKFEPGEIDDLELGTMDVPEGTSLTPPENDKELGDAEAEEGFGDGESDS